MNGLTVALISGAFIALLGLVIWFVEFLAKRKLDKKEKKTDDEEKKREEYIILILKMVSAAIALGEANSIALQNGKCNGETHKALEYAAEIKHQNRDFLTKIGVESIFN